MPRRFQSAYAGAPIVAACLLASCTRYGYEPVAEDGLGPDGAGGSLGIGGSIGFAGADGSGGFATDTSGTEATGTGGTEADTSAASTDATGGTSGTGGTASTDTGGSTGTDTGGVTNTDAGGAAGTGATVGSGGSGTGGATSTSSGGATSTSSGGATSTSAGGTATTGTTGGGDACAPAGTQDYIASFAMDLEGFGVTGSNGPSLTWTGLVGNPELGALELNASGGGVMQVRNTTPPGDLSGRVMSANVYVESEAPVEIMLYVRTGATGKWADGGAIAPPVGVWTCLTLDLDDPVTQSVGHDPTDVRVAGVDIQGSGDYRVYIDQFAY
ncbi:MAG TPA: hypothetical protein VFU02_03355 [Polyangiaceae bacterium]|nr:hypothetical protein [Polyangiaceae bacterium]